jgi:hypothetical protein
MDRRALQESREAGCTVLQPMYQALDLELMLRTIMEIRARPMRAASRYGVTLAGRRVYRAATHRLKSRNALPCFSSQSAICCIAAPCHPTFPTRRTHTAQWLIHQYKRTSFDRRETAVGTAKPAT